MACESLEGPSDMTTLQSTEVDAVSATVTVASDTLTSTQDSLQALKDSDQSEDETLWCYCQQSVQEELIGCDNLNCKIKWFHLFCLQLSTTKRVNGIPPNVTKRDINQGAREREKRSDYCIIVTLHCQLF